MNRPYVICQKETGKLLVALKQVKGWFKTTWDEPVFHYPNKSQPVNFKTKEKAIEMARRIKGQGFYGFYVRKAKRKEINPGWGDTH